VGRCYREANLFVQPSPNEGLAQVLLEAMASGLPVVATDKAGALECVTNGKEGLVVPARDKDALAEAILWCYQHREESREMGKAARRRIEIQFTLEHYNERVVALYRALAGRKG
jgi:glycosyltransferase involved in cell wall biosynthesis